MSTHNIRFYAILMSTHNICFYGEIMRIIPELSSNTHLVCSAVFAIAKDCLLHADSRLLSDQRLSIAIDLPRFG